MFAYCRTYDINSVQYLTAQTRHALREDKTSQPRLRPGAIPGTQIHLRPEDPKPDYVAAFKAFKKEKGLGSAKVQSGLHIMCGVSPEWLAEAGDIHDQKTPASVSFSRLLSRANLPGQTAVCLTPRLILMRPVPRWLICSSRRRLNSNTRAGSQACCECEQGSRSLGDRRG